MATQLKRVKAPKVKKGDVVIVVSGNDKGKTGEVKRVEVKRGRVLVVVLIAVVEMGIRLLDQVDLPLLDPLLTAPPIFALFFVGPIAKALELRKQAVAAPALAAA